MAEETIESILNKPPSFFSRTGTYFVMFILISGFLILDRTDVSQPIYVQGVITHILSHPKNKTQIIFKGLVPIKKIKLNDRLAILYIVGEQGKEFELSIQGRLDSVNTEKRLVYFSFFDSLITSVLIREAKAGTIQIKYVESNYFEIIKQKFLQKGS